jgi:hypothetical protein
MAMMRGGRRTFGVLAGTLAAGTLLLTACGPDADGDTYSDQDEINIGWDPNSADQDSNGIADNVQDLDGDHVLWYMEVVKGSSDTDDDTDDDGLGDLYEVLNGTNPAVADEIEFTVEFTPNASEIFHGGNVFTATHSAWPDSNATFTYEWQIENLGGGSTAPFGGPYTPDKAGWTLVAGQTYTITAVVYIDGSEVVNGVEHTMTATDVPPL